MSFPRFHFEAEHEQFRDTCVRFLQQEATPHVDRWRQQGMVDREIYRKAGEAGLLVMWAPEEFGGAGIADFRYDQVLMEEVIRQADIGLYFGLHSRLVAPYLGHLGTPEQKARWMPKVINGETILGIAMTEPAAGSDLAGMKTRAEDRGDHWLLNGSKTYISNGILGDLFIVAARTAPEQKHGIGLFLVERGMPGFERGRHLKKLGLHAQDTAELFFNDVKIPKENVLGDATRGFRYLTHFLAEERLANAVQSIVGAQVAWDLTLDFVKQRRAFGKPLAAFQNTRFKLAELRTQIDVVQSFIDQSVLLLNAGKLTPEIAAEAKLVASETEGRTVDECLQLFGGAGYMDEYRISRLYADARIGRIYAGTSEIMKEIIARGFGLDERKLV
ncbi:MAG: acyl-CoA dehydrogenase family protein [Gammaproteobacteria bacterium]